MQAYYPPVGFYFKVAFEGIEDATSAAFQEVSGLSADLETEEIVEGGENRFKYRVPTAPKYSNIVLKRGLMLKKSSLTAWCQSVMNSFLENPIQTRTLKISLLDSEGKPLMNWSIVNACPVNISISDMASQNDELVVETLEFAFNYFKKEL